MMLNLYSSQIKTSLLSISLILCLCISCASKEEVVIPPAPIEEAQAIPLLVEIHLAEAAAKSNKIKKDTTINLTYSIEEMYAFIFEKQNITQDSYESLIDYYSQYPEVYEKVSKKVLEEIETKLKNVKK